MDNLKMVLYYITYDLLDWAEATTQNLIIYDNDANLMVVKLMVVTLSDRYIIHNIVGERA
jgi:hypothetical protein